ncbi:hypothetical protein [Undibacterium curvum]|uniref:hypothetical protein n=1 Tax=Undibacterium curvum TaxID=2762294 RepID=UPI003D10FA00
MNRLQETTIVFSAPQAWGKTRNAAQLAAQFKCSEIVDDWQPGDPLKPQAIHLTCAEPVELAHLRCKVIARGWHHTKLRNGGAA